MKIEDEPHAVQNTTSQLDSQAVEERKETQQPYIGTSDGHTKQIVTYHMHPHFSFVVLQISDKTVQIWRHDLGAEK